MRAEINFSESHNNSGLQLGENTGTLNATMNTFAAGATVYLGKPFKISYQHYTSNHFSIQAAHPPKAPKTNFSTL